MNRVLIRFVFAGVLAGSVAVTQPIAQGAPAAPIQVGAVVDVSRDQTSQNETPIAVNPVNPNNMITGNNDWNLNDGCGVNTTTDGGAHWTPTLPNGFLPGITKFTNDPTVPGTGAYDAGGDPTIAFSPDGSTAYYVCQSFDFGSGHQIVLLLNRSHDGGLTWQSHGLSQISTFNGNGVSKGSNGSFPDHENLHVDLTNGYLYVTWAEFDGGGTHSPVYVAVSRDQGNTWTIRKVTANTVRNNQDQRVVTDQHGNAYLVFDNGVQGSKNTVLYVSKSTDGGLSWSAPIQFAALTDPVCTFPPTCFNIAGGAFRSGGSYPAPAFDTTRNRLDVIYSDIEGPVAQVYFTSAPADDLTHWSTPAAIAPGNGDRFQGEMSTSSTGRIDVSFYDRSYSGNKLVDLTYATSSDGGVHWSTARVTPVGFDPSQWGVPQGTGFRPFIGDYNGIASTPTSARLTWTGFADPQPFNLEVDYATVTP